MSDIFREVDEEVRQDRALAFWNRYQLWFLIAAAVIVIATAGWRFHQSRQQAFAEETGARYLAAVQASREGKSADAIGFLEGVVQNGTPGYRQLAALRLADEYGATDGKRAIEAYDKIAGDASFDPLLRDAARLRAAVLVLNTGEVKDGINRLTPLAGANGTFRSTARELLATAAISADDYETAGRWLDEIVRDPAAPQDIRQRADAFLALVHAGRKK